MNYGCGYVENNFSTNLHMTIRSIFGLRTLWREARLSTDTSE